MNTMRILTATAFATAIVVTTVAAQQPPTQRVRGTIEKVDGNTLLIKTPDGAPASVTLADNAVVVGVLKATVADIKEGSYIGSGALPQPDGTQKAVEVHIFAESQRGTGDGHRGNWDGSPYGAGIGTMTNGAVGQSVSSVDGPVITVKYKEGKKRLSSGRTFRSFVTKSATRASSNRAPLSASWPQPRSRTERSGPHALMSAATGSCRCDCTGLPPLSACRGEGTNCRARL